MSLIFCFLFLGILLYSQYVEDADFIRYFLLGSVGTVTVSVIAFKMMFDLLTDQQYRDRVFGEKRHPLLLQNPIEKELSVSRVLIKNAYIRLAYSISVVAVFAFFGIFLKMKIDGFFVNMPLHTLFSSLFLLGFICFSFFVLGYLLIGGILKRHFKREKNNFLIDIFFCYIVAIRYFVLLLAIPYVALLHFTWVLFIHRYSTIWDIEGLEKSFLVRLKYYLYINLASIAFEDKHTYTSFEMSSQYCEDEKDHLFFIWIDRTPVTIPTYFMFSFFCFGVWNRVLNLVHTSFTGLVLKIMVILFFVSFLLRLLYELIYFLFYFIHSRHQECHLTTLR